MEHPDHIFDVRDSLKLELTLIFGTDLQAKAARLKQNRPTDFFSTLSIPPERPRAISALLPYFKTKTKCLPTCAEIYFVYPLYHPSARHTPCPSSHVLFYHPNLTLRHRYPSTARFKQTNHSTFLPLSTSFTSSTSCPSPPVYLPPAR